MIVVVADDLSGAAEIGAVGLRYGLKTVVSTELLSDAVGELVVVDTNSRSVSERLATSRMAAVAHALRASSPAWIYKKIDSVLRGHVLAELRALLDGLERTKALILPANPTLGRTLRGGSYYIDGVPLHLTSFAADAEYPAATSDVLELMGNGRHAVSYAAGIGTPVGDDQLVVGDAASMGDLVGWTASVSDSVLPAGGADFFAALLAARGYRPDADDPAANGFSGFPPSRGIYLIGSQTPQSRLSMRRLRAAGYAVPSFEGADAGRSLSEAEWLDRLGRLLHDRKRVIVTGESLQNVPAEANDDGPARLARLTARLLREATVDDVIVEGGTTASLLVRGMGWNRFTPKGELGRGIVRMAVDEEDGLVLTVKPGSYLWPEP